MKSTILSESQNGGLLLPVTQVRDRVGEALGIGSRTVGKILSEKYGPSGSDSNVLHTPKKRKRNKPVTGIDEFDSHAIRNHIYGYFTRGEFPTLAKLCATLKDAGLYKGSIESLRTVITGIGFRYKKVDKRKIVMERHDIIMQRLTFLREVKQIINNWDNVIFLDETWLNSNHSVPKTWTDDSEASCSKVPIGKGGRLIICHAGSASTGFVENSLLAFQSKSTKEYHEEMDAVRFREWFLNLLQNIPPNSTIIMDNAPYHSVQIDKAPTSANKKADLVAWLQRKGVDADMSLLKAELLQLVKLHKPPKPTYVIDQLAEEHGHKVIRLPPYHCQYNAIELIWAQVKGVSGTKDIGRRRTVPVLFTRGTHYEVGFDIGRTFSTLITSYLSTYEGLRKFEQEYKTEAGQRAYDTTLANMVKRYPYYVKEIQGVADGANVPFHKLFLLQMDDLIDTINDNHIPRNDTGGCSSMAFKNPQATILAHTEDAPKATLNHFYIMSAHIIPAPEDRELGAVEERFTSLCYAGWMPGYTMGFNQNGLVFSINTLSPMNLKAGNTPRTFLTRAMLSAKNFAEAESILRDEGLGIGNGFSVNMIWTNMWNDHQIYNVEVAPDFKADHSQLNIQRYDMDPLLHCNKYHRLNVTEVTGDIIQSSLARLKTIQSYPKPRDRKDIEEIFSDTSRSEYNVFQDKPAEIMTIAAGIFDLNKRTWSIYINPPKSSEPVAVLPIAFTSLDY